MAFSQPRGGRSRDSALYARASAPG
jgi:hypothetical protein